MYRWVDHTAELELEVEAPSPQEIFTEAAAAIGELLGDEGGSPADHAVSASAPDRATLLAEWLNELVYLAETAGFIPETVTRLELTETTLDAELSGRRGSPSALVKAVTYHRLGMWEQDETWRARVVLDV